MNQDSSVMSLEMKLEAKRSQQAQFQTIIDQYNYALALLNKEIDQLTDELYEGDADKKLYRGNDWDTVIVNVIANAGRPLAKEEIETALVNYGMIPEFTTNPKQYIYQKILHAQKREVISRCNVAGCRKLYYGLPAWADNGQLTTNN